MAAFAYDFVIGTVVNPAGLILAKTIPASRLTAFSEAGFGASPSWHGFAIDQVGIAFNDDIGVVGDHRILADHDALRTLGDGVAWVPGSFYDQQTQPVPSCSRGTLRRIEDRLAATGLTARIGHEIEFYLVGPDGAQLPAALWAQYGLAGVLEHETFIRDVTASAGLAGIGIEQFHPEYGPNQFELSLAPQSPVAAADQLVLTKLVLGRTARKYGMRVSFSPVPFAGMVGSGAHQHFSLSDDSGSLFEGGDGPSGMTRRGRHVVAGLVDGLPEAQAILCGSVVSGLRMKPGHWAGAYTCWGTENREAAIRFLPAGPGKPHGANVEVKVIDPSANPYFASAAVLALALDGLDRESALPPETTVDPATLTAEERAAAGTVLLPSDQGSALDALDGSTRLRAALGDQAVDAILTVRRYENDNFGDLAPEALTDRFRMAWSV